MAEIAKVNGITERNIYKLQKLCSETGNVVPTRTPRPKAKLDEDDLKRVEKCIQECADITTNKLREELEIPLSESELSRIAHESCISL